MGQGVVAFRRDAHLIRHCICEQSSSSQIMSAIEITWKSGNDTVTVAYCHKGDHRNAAPGKSQWDISKKDERTCFTDAMRAGWTRQKFAWGLHLQGGTVSILGRDRDHKTPSFIARFDEHAEAEWHGYPVDHRKMQQRPPGEIVREWFDRSLISKAQTRKIVCGQPCRI